MTARNPTQGGRKSPTEDHQEVQTDGSGNGPNWEQIARRELASNLLAMLEADLYETGHSIVHAIGQGEPVDDDQLNAFRSRVYEFDERVTHARREFGEIDIQSDAERLLTERRTLAHWFRRLAKSARRGKLSRHEVDDAREELQRAQQTLDSIAEELEE